MLNDAFNNTSGWTLEFQLNAGFDGYGSNIIIDNINLTADSSGSTDGSQSVKSIPTLSEWGVLILSSILLLVVATKTRKII